MFHRSRFRCPLSTSLFLAGGFTFVAATIGTTALAEPVVVGGTGKPSVTVDLSVLETLGAPPMIPRLLMPGPGPARNGAVTLQQLGATPQMPTPAAESKPRITLTPPPMVAMPEAPAAMKEAPAAIARPEPKILLTPPPPEKAPAAEKEAPVAVKETPTPPPPEKAPAAEKEAPVAVKEAPTPPPAPVIAMPETPPPPVVLTKPKAAPQAALAEDTATPKATPMAAKPAADTRKPAPEETAKLPPAAAPLEPGKPIQVTFGSESALLSDTAKATLEKFATHLKNNPGLRVQLLAHASGTEEAASQARRLSLSRALVVRSFLIEQGLTSIRIDVRALGNKGNGEPADRVDLVFTGS